MTDSPPTLGGRMAAAAARAVSGLADESRALLRSFLESKLSPHGGFVGRSGEPDLYYTQFGMAAAAALDMPLPGRAFRQFLARFAEPAALDMVHLASLVRCQALLAPAPPAMAAAIEALRRPDGGYAPGASEATGTVYGSFLALLALEHLMPPGAGARMAGLDRFLDSARAPDGGYANRPGEGESTATTTAAALALGRCAGASVPADAVRWLAACHTPGGFRASARAPVPDLLSTATALLALELCSFSLDEFRKPCIDLVERCWQEDGGFASRAGDPESDCEYTFYALLTLGCLLKT